LVSNSTSSAGELLSSGRLEALLRGMEDSLSASNSASSSSMRVMGTQKQQAALGRLRQSLPLLQLIGINFFGFPIPYHKGLSEAQRSRPVNFCLWHLKCSYS